VAQFRKDSSQYLPQEKTIFEVVMLSDEYGNIIGSNPSGMAVDAFGRARVSTPLTVFDQFHRFQDNSSGSTSNSAFSSSFSHDANSSSVLLSLGTSNGAFVYRETPRVFPYQPGKSLQILGTFVMSPPQVGLRQRYGYFGSDNGFFLEVDGTTINFVRRSRSSGTIVETRVSQDNWNIDALDGSNNRNPSGIILDITKAQIIFYDVEWLGVGTVRTGFVIDGKFIHCHSWNHANQSNNTYITTACLPIRSEIENTANTSLSSNLRVICSTVISEGGYELRGRPKTIGHEPLTPYDLATAGTYYPVALLRLKSNRSDAIVIPRNIKLAGTSSSGSVFRYKVIVGSNITGGLWIDAGSDTSTQYNMNAASFTGGTEFISGYITVTNQSNSPVTLDDQFFRYQLERNSFNNTNTVFGIVVSSSKSNDKLFASIDWEEVT
jgi:hypothetical protein